MISAEERDQFWRSRIEKLADNHQAQAEEADRKADYKGAPGWRNVAGQHEAVAEALRSLLSGREGESPDCPLCHREIGNPREHICGTGLDATPGLKTCVTTAGTQDNLDQDSAPDAGFSASSKSGPSDSPDLELPGVTDEAQVEVRSAAWGRVHAFRHPVTGVSVGELEWGDAVDAIIDATLAAVGSPSGDTVTVTLARADAADYLAESWDGVVAVRRALRAALSGGTDEG